MLDVTRNDEGIHARMVGELTIFQAEELFVGLKPLVAENCDLVIDASEVCEIDSSAVQILLVMKETLKANGHQLTLTRHSDPVLDLMAVMGLGGCFNDPVVESTDGKDQGASRR